MCIIKGNCQSFHIFLRREFEHGIDHYSLAYRAQATGAKFKLYGFVYNKIQYLVVKLQLYTFVLKQFFVLFQQRVFWLGEYIMQRLSVQRIKIGEYWQTAY